jgi:hypothetical protein
MIFYFEIPKNSIDQIKFKLSQKIKAGMLPEDAVKHGVKYINKLLNKSIRKHKVKALINTTNALHKSLVVDKEYMNDPMERLNNETICSTKITCE